MEQAQTFLLLLFLLLPPTHPRSSASRPAPAPALLFRFTCISTATAFIFTPASTIFTFASAYRFPVGGDRRQRVTRLAEPSVDVLRVAGVATSPHAAQPHVRQGSRRVPPPPPPAPLPLVIPLVRKTLRPVPALLGSLRVPMKRPRRRTTISAHSAEARRPGKSSCAFTSADTAAARVEDAPTRRCPRTSPCGLLCGCSHRLHPLDAPTSTRFGARAERGGGVVVRVVEKRSRVAKRKSGPSRRTGIPAREDGGPVAAQIACTDDPPRGAGESMRVDIAEQGRGAEEELNGQVRDVAGISAREDGGMRWIFEGPRCNRLHALLPRARHHRVGGEPPAHPPLPFLPIPYTRSGSSCGASSLSCVTAAARLLLPFLQSEPVQLRVGHKGRAQEEGARCRLKRNRLRITSVNGYPSDMPERQSCVARRLCHRRREARGLGEAQIGFTSLKQTSLVGGMSRHAKGWMGVLAAYTRPPRIVVGV
ncbi:hypothetical protein B0H13DRAFT_1886337 [Mycena leptocephala]|nr:hypothetical protein B0H13DRAFT_1886337 [Mycena leptocephala]